MEPKRRQPASTGCAGILLLREVVGLDQQRWPYTEDPRRRMEVTQQEDAMMRPWEEGWGPEESRTILLS